MSTHPVGTQFMTLGKHPRKCTIRDVLTTYNAAGDLFRIEYISDCEYLGGTIEQRDNAVTVARGIARLNCEPF